MCPGHLRMLVWGELSLCREAGRLCIADGGGGSDAPQLRAAVCGSKAAYPSLLDRWVQIRFPNWLDEHWFDRDVVASPQSNKLWHHLKTKEEWEPTFPAGYFSGSLPFVAMRNMCLSITYAEHNVAEITAAAAAANGTNTPVGDRVRVLAAVAITAIRGGRPAAVVVPPIDTASCAATKTAAKTKNSEPPGNPLKVVVVNPDYNESQWGTCKAHCGPMRNVINYCKVTNPLPPHPL